MLLFSTLGRRRREELWSAFQLLVTAPDAVDFSDPTIPPGLDAAKVASGIEEDLRLMHARGWEAEHLPIRTDEDLKQRISSHLQGKSFDCIVIGGGVRMTEKHVPELERVVNTIRESAPLTPNCV